ncbi:serine/threonine kinase 16 [Hortaea werneckii]|nr:serine/threonine kinase 16 [Hortaea werneckii]KAI6998376.1 serine/threonine kinase 16 [Hortaea werneckii]KAI7149116.1 serine/threonine kinase 16 [Hortaea werneckii]KAI7169364.1 serine/threonine kinase 16 [Hortaea werneckii]
MGLGVLEDRHLERVPGTSTLKDLTDTPSDLPQDAVLKRSKDGTILVPQPSDDPRDPLNWPLWRRDLITGILCLLSVIASTLSPLLAANSILLKVYFVKPFTDIALLTGYHLLGVGVAGFIFVASARVWGKRHLYLLGTVIIIITSAWGGASNQNYNSLMAARFFQGVGLAPFEALVNASVGDLYFVHERGKRMAFSNLSLFGGAFFTPVIVGRLTATLTWQWSFYFLAIFTAVMLPLVVLFVPETAFVREERFNTDIASNSRADYHGKEVRSGASSLDKEPNQSSSETVVGSPPSFYSKESLMPFNGRKTDESFFKLLLRPFPLFFHPGILWACLTQGTIIGWTVLIGIVLGGIMLGPPLWFNEVETGYMYTGAFVGAVVGFILAGLLSDSSARFMAKRNNGVYEPEFRIVLVIPMLILGCAGLYGFGITANNTYRYGWFWPDFFFALEVAGMVLGAVASALYIVDAHRDIAVEGFTCLLVFKNIFSFGLTFSGWGWLVNAGIRPVFIAISSVQVVICCLSVLMYVFGKKNRSFFARHDILATLKLR